MREVEIADRPPSQMPRLDGLQSTLLIREMGYNAPIVALTASAESDIVERGMEVGIDSFMRCVLETSLPPLSVKVPIANQLATASLSGDRR